MKFLVKTCLLLLIPVALAQEQATPASCRQKERLFYNSPSISKLPAAERAGIIKVVSPDLKASENKMGYDSQDLTPGRLALLLRYTELAAGTDGQRVAAVTFQDEASCGIHGQCPGYLLGIGPRGVRSLVPNTGPTGFSIGGTWGAAVLEGKTSAYPDLLVLATVSGSEVAVACYRWQGTTYAGHCDVPCAQVLAHPDQE